jgi:signal transduction histidine kinase
MTTKTIIEPFIQTAPKSVAAVRQLLVELASTLPRKGEGRLLHKLLLLFMALSLLPVLLASFALIAEGEKYIQKEIVGVKLGIAQKVASDIKSYMDDKKNLLQIVHKSGDFLTMNSLRQSEILSNVMNSYPMFMRLTVLDVNGDLVSTVNRVGAVPATEATHEEMEALRSIRSLGDYIGPVSKSPEGYPQMTLAVPVERVPGRPLGVLLAVVNLVDLSSLVKDIAIDTRGYVYVVSTDPWQMVAHPDVDTLLGASKPAEIRALEALRRAHPDVFDGQRADSGAIEIEDEAGKFLSTYARVPEKQLEWKVFVQQPVAEAYRASRQMRQKILFVLMGVFILTILVGLWVSRMIVTRVRTLQDAVERVGEGDFDVPDVPQSNDEFGALAGKFIWMARSLKDKTLKLISAQKELQRWNSDLERRVQERTRDLKEAQDQLIAHEKLAALGQMASVVGHELRNPLAVMNNSVYFLKTKLAGTGKGGIDPKIEKHLNIVEGEIVKSNTIIRDVLDFVRNRAINASPHKLDELVAQAIERIQIPTGVSLSKALTLGPTEVMVDEDELRQVLVNLMENACQAMVKGGTLTVGTKAQGDSVEISIADTGCGIPQEHLKKIFDAFFTTKSRGTGLGLAVVKKIIDRHQGQIDVQSKVGEGTRFRIRLPVKGAPSVPPPAGGLHG